MLYRNIFLFFITLLLFNLSCIDGVFVACNIELHLSVEDVEMHTTITNVKFNHEEIDISKKSFMHRKVTQVLNVSPGEYEIEWTLERSEKPWGGKKNIQNHKRLIVLELSDAVVHIHIKSETITTY